jgi:pimeloyl-ACP methyl ester carboxylesterase
MAYLSDGGERLFYKEAGSGPPILLIHGTSIDADTWGPSFDALAADHRVVAYDRRGHSRTREAGAAATGDWDLHARDAIAFLEQLELAPATVVGWSGGGVVALKLALARPDLLSALVLVEPAFDAPHNVTGTFLRAFLRSRVLYALGRERAGYERFIRFVCTRRGGINSWDDPDFPQDRREVGYANAGAHRAEMAARKGLPEMDRMSELRMPVTVVLGEQSDVWFHKMALAVPKAIPHAQLRRIPDANHAFGFTAPHALAEVIHEAARDSEGAALS